MSAVQKQIPICSKRNLLAWELILKQSLAILSSHFLCRCTYCLHYFCLLFQLSVKLFQNQHLSTDIFCLNVHFCIVLQEDGNGYCRNMSEFKAFFVYLKMLIISNVCGTTRTMCSLLYFFCKNITRINSCTTKLARKIKCFNQKVQMCIVLENSFVQVCTTN